VHRLRLPVQPEMAPASDIFRSAVVFLGLILFSFLNGRFRV
jgi:hypothetical protein